MDPHTGRVLALVGGFDFEKSNFNRASQAYRQPGSVFKPFVYLTGINAGYSPTTPILDNPWVVKQPDDTVWRPINYDERFLGAQPMHVGLEWSRNLMTVRLANAVGMDRVVDTATAFGVGRECGRIFIGVHRVRRNHLAGYDHGIRHFGQRWTANLP